MPLPPIPDPYEGVTDLTRISADIKTYDLYRVKSVCMDRTFISDTTKRLIKHLTEYCIKKGLNIDDRDQLISYVTDLLPIDPVGPTEGGPNPEGRSLDDGRGTTRIRPAGEGPSDESTTSLRAQTTTSEKGRTDTAAKAKPTKQPPRQ